jgi:hypothetical protein
MHRYPKGMPTTTLRLQALLDGGYVTKFTVAVAIGISTDQVDEILLDASRDESVKARLEMLLAAYQTALRIANAQFLRNRCSELDSTLLSQ